MKKYLREIERSGMVLLAIGIVVTLFRGAQYGAWPCGVGLVLLLMSVLYKAFHWDEYEKENKTNIVVVIMTILILLFQMLRIKG